MQELTTSAQLAHGNIHHLKKTRTLQGVEQGQDGEPQSNETTAGGGFISEEDSKLDVSEQKEVPSDDADWMRSRTSRLLGLVDDERRTEGFEPALSVDLAEAIALTGVGADMPCSYCFRHDLSCRMAEESSRCSECARRGRSCDGGLVGSCCSWELGNSGLRSFHAFDTSSQGSNKRFSSSVGERAASGS